MEAADPPDPPTTGFLLDRIRAGDRASLEILFARSYRRLERVVRIRWGRGTQPRYDLADVLQEAFLKAWRGLDGYSKQPDYGFLDWVARIAENTLRDQARRQSAARRDPSREQSLPPRGSTARLELDEQIACRDKGPREWAEEQERAQRLDACLAELPEAEREVLVLRFYLEESWQEVGQHLGRTARGAEQLARRARERLAALYRERHPEERDG